jgi:phosphoribosylformylglycinamidine synthase
MKFAVIQFPGTNCEIDTAYILKDLLEQEADIIWHMQDDLSSYDLVILPGGSSYGDYLRTGALAKFSPIIEAIKKHAEQGKLVLGICNGFQILTEIGLLPGAFMKNQNLKFIGDDLFFKVINNSTPFTSSYSKEQILKLPVAHLEGNYYIDSDQLKELQAQNRIVLRYCNSQGLCSEQTNPNGSVDNIAAVLNERGNVLGMMPHPERMAEEILGGQDGLGFFQSILEYHKERKEQ